MNALRNSLAGGPTLLMPNVWDIRSAGIAHEGGFSAVGTSSAAIAAMLGGADGEGTRYEEMLAWDRKIVQSLPSIDVNVDFEAGYGLTGDQIVSAVSDLGCSGINLEDSSHKDDGQVDRDIHATKLADISDGLAGLSRHPVLTARVDSMLDLIHQGKYGDSPEAYERLDDCIDRAIAYLRAGADVVFPIGLNTARQMQKFFSHVPPKKTSLLIPFLDNRIEVIRGSGVGRISFGGTAREAGDELLRKRLRVLSGKAGPLRMATHIGGAWLGRRIFRLSQPHG